VSGHTAEVIFDRGISDTAVDYLPKPLSPNKLLQKVREVLDR
jgi:DNA-binding response OmpR family regulator